jgi:hypothetical protein
MSGPQAMTVRQLIKQLIECTDMDAIVTIPSLTEEEEGELTTISEDPQTVAILKVDEQENEVILRPTTD